ncbi:MAG: phosphoenolpyruvate--protein phosphotransferase [Bdellovibrionaceae bacterium]|nr:phosphoenolpyruvate--protein phosphotransferase [Pseudobdellovibrionaceae bacterium]
MTSTILKGIAIAPGFAVARAFHIQRDVSSYSKQSSNSEVDLELFKNAVTVAVQQISTLRERVLLKMGPDKAQIFEAHLEMLQDPEYHEQIEQQIQKGSSVAESIARVTDNFFKIFQAMEDTYLRERGQDILDIGKRLKMICLGLEPFNPLLLTEPVVLVADEIMPSEVALFDREFIKAVVTEKGGITSHAAILLKNLEIPTIFGVKDLQQKIAPNIWVSVDGVLGQLELLGIQDQAPPEAKAKVAAWERQRTELQSIKDLPCKTKSGVEISLLSNLSSLVDAEQSKASGAIGVGLFRTEFLFSEKSHAPSEEEQFQIYKQLLQHFPQGKVVIRPWISVETSQCLILGLKEKIILF